MNTLNELELTKIEAGGISAGAALAIGAAIVFIIGLIDGFVNPNKCN